MTAAAYCNSLQMAVKTKAAATSELHSGKSLAETSAHVFVQMYVCWCVCVFLYWENSVGKNVWHFCIANLLLILMAKLGAWYLICIPAEIGVGMPLSKHWKWHEIMVKKTHFWKFGIFSCSGISDSSNIQERCLLETRTEKLEPTLNLTCRR